ncbi:MAG TPA: hypothetical protein VGQ36_07450 [Thermoanaerobaculia bacterium]|nr:hypothetical protein [Thermoanaerobaculia bacterium]
MVAFLGSLAILGLIWFQARSDSLGEALHRLAEARSKHPSLSRPRSALDLLRRAQEELSSANRLLSEVYSIGIWVKADDCSDNRRKRTGLREADWAASGAYRALNEIECEWPDLQTAVNSLAQEVDAIVRALEPLPDTIPDTMGDNLELDCTVSTLAGQVEALRERVEAILADCANRTAQDSGEIIC